MPSNEYHDFWDVKFAWEDARGYVTAGAHVDVKDAASAMDAIRVAAAWRDVPLSLVVDVTAERPLKHW